MKGILTLFLILLSFSSFAEVKEFKLKTVSKYETSSFFDYQKGIFEAHDGKLIVISCRENDVWADDFVIRSYKDNKVVDKFETDIDDSDVCHDDLKQIIQSIETGKMVSLKVGLTGFTFSEME